MKKIFLSIFLLFSILTYSAGHIEELSQPKPIKSNKEKVVSITGFPSDFENTLEGILESNQRDINQIFENIIYLEILRKGYSVRIGKINDLEVDFVCIKGKEKIYIQVAYLLASPETIEREFSLLEKINDNYPKYVISMDECDMSRNGIRHINIIDFLIKS